MGTFKCIECGGVFHESKTGITTGYGWDPEKKGKLCFPCCGKLERARMIETGKCLLYLSPKTGAVSMTLASSWRITNWPNSLAFEPYYVKEGRHNMAGTRMDVWFIGPDDCVWHGTQYGEMSQLLHCKRTKEKKEV